MFGELSDRQIAALRVANAPGRHADLSDEIKASM